MKPSSVNGSLSLGPVAARVGFRTDALLEPARVVAVHEDYEAVRLGAERFDHAWVELGAGVAKARSAITSSRRIPGDSVWRSV